MNMRGGGGGGANNGGGGGGPCGACKFLRRKCVKGCIFAPYFDSEQGTAHFAAVHKVFGASNASKLLSRIPPHHRLDAVVTLCYEALARVKDPVYGCVGHIFTLQQQVVNLQAELAYIQARLSTLQRLPVAVLPPPPPPSLSNIASTSASHNDSNMHLLDHIQLQPQQQLTTTSDLINNQLDPEVNDGELQALAREFVSKYLPGVRLIKPPTSPS